jgi:hypothetical protein
VPASSYRERLRSEGLTLAAVSAVASGAILATQPQARRWPLNTVAQLALAAAAMATLGRRSVRTALDGAVELTPGAEGDGDPTPLWQVPAPVLGLAVAVGDIPAPDRRFIRRRGEPARGWDASLRATGGGVLAGLAQALLYEREVAQAETIQDRTYYRLPGSSLFSGTKLGFVRRS